MPSRSLRSCVLSWILVIQIALPGPNAHAGPTDESTLMGARGQVANSAASGVGSVGASEFTGAATYSFPIDVAPGTGGMQPSIALRYSSQSRSDSWVGYGWDLRLPSISRSLKKGVPSYIDTGSQPDSFTFDGQVLIADAAPASPACTNPSRPQQYRTRRESFLRITFECDGSWTVRRKDGGTLRLGVDDGSRVVRADGKTFEWLLATEEDLNGNAYSVTYKSYEDPGMLYPDSIKYTLRRSGGQLVSISAGNDREVKFVVEARPDEPVSYLRGFESRLAHRLSDIEVRTSGILVRRYKLSYLQSEDSARSLLQHVDLYGAGTDLPGNWVPLRTTFGYRSNVADGKAGWAPPLTTWTWAAGGAALSLVSASNRDQGVRLADMDGDGRPDLVKAFAEAATPTQLTTDSGVYLNTGTGFASSKAQSFTDAWPTYVGTIPGSETPATYPLVFARTYAFGGGSSWGNGMQLLDLTGDGKSDVFGAFAVTPFEPPPPPGVQDPPLLQTIGGPWCTSNGASLDCVAQSQIVSDGSLSTAKFALTWVDRQDNLIYGLTNTAVPANFDGNTRFADLDGDGLADAIVRGAESYNKWRSSPVEHYCKLQIHYSYTARNLGGLSFEIPPDAIGGRTDICNHAEGDGWLIRRTEGFEVCDLLAGNAADFEACWKKTHFNAFDLAESSPYSDYPEYFWVAQTHQDLGNVVLDLNSDGLADALSATDDVGSPIGWAGLNDGTRNYKAAPAWELPSTVALVRLDPISLGGKLVLPGIHLPSGYEGGIPNLGLKKSTDRGVRFGDVNGDGRVDIVQALEGSTPNVWLNEPSSSGAWVAETANWQLPLGVGGFAKADGMDTGLRFVDLDGDGMVDLVRSSGGANSVWLNQGEIPDVMTSVTSAIGGKTTIEYDVSTSPIYDNAGVGGVPALPRAIPVVKSISRDPMVSGASGPILTTSYFYKGGVYDSTDREFRGFREVVVRSFDSMTTRVYHQDVARAGLIESETIASAQGTRCFLKSEYEYTPDTDAPYTSQVQQVTSTEFGGQPCNATSSLRLTRTAYTYSGGVGNVAQVLMYGEILANGTDVNPSDSRTIHFEYATPNDALYLVSLPCRVSLREGIGTGGALASRTRIQYGVNAPLCPTSAPTTGNPWKISQLKSLSGDATSVEYTYDEYGNVESTKDPRGFVATRTYDSTYHAFVVSETSPPVAGAPDGLVVSFAFSPASGQSCPAGARTLPIGAGLAYRITDPNGGETRRCYDEFGRVLRETAPGQTGEVDLTYIDTAVPRQVVRTESINSQGNARVATTFLDGLGRTYRVDQDGPKTTAGVHRNIRSTATFDAKGRLASQSDPHFTTGSPLATTFEYDPLDRQTAMVLPGSGGARRTTAVFDEIATGQVIPGRVKLCDANNNRIDQQFDAFGQLSAVREFEGANPCSGTSGLTERLTTYEYRVSGALKRVLDAAGNETLLTYPNLLEQDRTLADPDVGNTTVTHDDSGNVVSITDAANTVTTYSYDALNRPTSRRVNSRLDAAWLYDTSDGGRGRLAKRIDESGAYEVVAYDHAGRPLLEQRSLGGVTLSFNNTYDRLGQLLSREYPTGRRLDWLYDTKGYLSSIRDPNISGPYASLLDWDALLRLQSYTSGSGFSSVVAYDSGTNRPASAQIRDGSGVPIESWQYGFDNGDRLTSIQDLVAASKNRAFGYDTRDRLSSSTHFRLSPPATLTAINQYDPIGNLTCLGSGEAGGGCAGTSMVYPPAPARPRHSPASVQGHTASHDSIGNLKSWEGAVVGGPRGFSYDPLGRLTSVSRAGSMLASYVYNADGRRVTTTEYLGRKVVSHIVSDDFEWDQTRGLARVHVLLQGTPIATIVDDWSGPSSGAAVVSGWAPRIDGYAAASALYASLALMLLLQLLDMRRRGIPLRRPAVAGVTLIFFAAGFVVPRGAWAALGDGDINQDGRLDAADVLRALEIAKGASAASPFELDHGDVAPLGGAPESPQKVDAGDATLLLRGATGQDVDGDGLTPDEELAVGASPFRADSDGDGLSDSAELAAGTNPDDIDTNDNNVLDGNEDTDGDGVTNYEESVVRKTDPAFADTDGDGLPDNTDEAYRSATLYHFRDHLGSVVVVVRASDGGIARQSRYSAFGGVDFNPQPAVSSPGYIGVFGFTGQRYERAVGLYDYNARWYEPQLGQFLQPDAIVPQQFNPRSLSRYAYVKNDPVGRTDPSGYSDECQWLASGCGVFESPDSQSGGYSPDPGYPGGTPGPGAAVIELVHPSQSGGQAGGQALNPREWGRQWIAQFFAPLDARLGSNPSSQGGATYSPAPAELIGTRDYYIWRNEHAPESYKNGEGPNYYTDYGLAKFDAFQSLREGASSALQGFIDRTGRELQLGLEQRLQANPAIEFSRGALYNAAFDSHSTAYTAGGFWDLSWGDRARVVGTIGADVFNPLTIREGWESLRGR